MPLDPPNRPDPGDVRFDFGIASGDPTATSIVFWTHVVGARRLRLEAISDDGTTVVRHAVAESEDPTPEGSGQVARLRVGGLSPATGYRYRFVDPVSGVASPSGRTRTLPAPDDGRPLRVAVVCCGRLAPGSFELYAQVAQEHPDLVVHVGDYIYQDGEAGPGGQHDPSHECVDTADYERRYRQYRSRPELQRLHAAAPWIAVWDDHEFANDAWRWGSALPDTRVRWADRRNDAADAFTRWMPQDRHGNGPTPVDRCLELGAHGPLLVVDVRMAGRTRPSGGAGGPTLERPGDDRALLAPEQWAWLEERASTVPTDRRCLVVSSVQVAPLHLAPVPFPGRRPWRWLVNPDQWDGFPVERTRLLGLLARRAAERPDLILSGDLHARFSARLGSEGRLGSGERRNGGVVAREVTTPAISSPTFAEAVRSRVPLGPRLLERWLRLWNPHLEEMDLDRHGATILEIREDNAITVRGLVRPGQDPPDPIEV